MPDNVHRVYSHKRSPSSGEVEPPCEHIGAVTELPEPSAHACADCIAAGDSWVHLRLCLECGYVGCCDSSSNRHATAHHRATGHLLVRGIEPGERWVYCYEDLETGRL